MGAVAVSNSWKVPEFVHEATGSYAAYFDHPGMAFLASSGDGGSGKGRTIGYPAGLPTVVAVGGTSLVADDSARGWTESAWAGAGSACGQYVAKPAWQTDPGCPMRTTSDVSAVADPRPGSRSTSPTPRAASAGWSSAAPACSSPLIAGVYGQAGNTAALGSGISAYLYAHADQLYDVTTGSNGTGCAIAYICNAGPGYDGPTGLGTPNGLGAF